MGAKQSADGCDADFTPTHRDMASRLEKRVGFLPIQARYHGRGSKRRLEDDYEIHYGKDEVLGVGLNGAVRLATSKVPRGVKCAVKTFRLTDIAKAKRLQVAQEVEVFLSMDHPHITRLYDVYECEQTITLVMECMEGGELFDRVVEQKRFSEADAADAVYQMLLGLNYIHSHNMVHRDLKLENFLYDRKGSNHLKLIDFGFSKVWDPNMKMRMSCGTLSYVAPEVLNKDYTNKCDLWSLGVITFILLAGYMPFSGPDKLQTQNILAGKFTMKHEKWGTVTKLGRDFVLSLLEVKVEKRLSAQEALEHNWISERQRKAVVEVDESIVHSLREFAQASAFRRRALEMMAWSLTNEDRAEVRAYFLEMDTDKQGTIQLSELKALLQDRFHVSGEETMRVFEALDTNNDEAIHYSDFLAAMVNKRINMHDDLLRAAFMKFDNDNSGYITRENLQWVFGDGVDSEDIAAMIADADQLKDGRISYVEFVAYLKGEKLEDAERIIDRQIEQATCSFSSEADGKKALTRPSETGFILPAADPVQEEKGNCVLQ